MSIDNCSPFLYMSSNSSNKGVWTCGEVRECFCGASYARELGCGYAREALGISGQSTVAAKSSWGNLGVITTLSTEYSGFSTDSANQEVGEKRGLSTSYPHFG
jgi:hypothetical protein